MGIKDGDELYETPAYSKAYFWLEGKPVEGYSLLTINDGRYFFFKQPTSWFGHPEIRIVKEDEVKDLRLRVEENDSESVQKASGPATNTVPEKATTNAVPVKT